MTIFTRAERTISASARARRTSSPNRRYIRNTTSSIKPRTSRWLNASSLVSMRSFILYSFLSSRFVMTNTAA